MKIWFWITFHKQRKNKAEPFSEVIDVVKAGWFETSRDVQNKVVLVFKIWCDA